MQVTMANYLLVPFCILNNSEVEVKIVALYCHIDRFQGCFQVTVLLLYYF